MSLGPARPLPLAAATAAAMAALAAGLLTSRTSADSPPPAPPGFEPTTPPPGDLLTEFLDTGRSKKVFEAEDITTGVEVAFVLAIKASLCP